MNIVFQGGNAVVFLNVLIFISFRIKILTNLIVSQKIWFAKEKIAKKADRRTKIPVRRSESLF